MPAMRTLRVGAAPGKNDSSRTSSRLAESPSQIFEKRSVNVYLSPRVFGGFWAAIMATHCVCAVFPAAIGVLYRYLLTTVFMDNITSNSLSVDKRYYPAISNVYFAFSAIHCSMLLMYIVRSIRCRKLTFRMPVISGATASPPEFRKGLPTIVEVLLARLKVELLLAHTKQVVVRILQQMQPWVPRLILWFFTGIWNVGKVYLAAMDIRSENYGILFLLREIIQTFLQSYQAYRVSTMVPRLWINNVIVGFLVLNCWSTPLIQFFSHSTSVGYTRLCCAIVSVLLDVVSYIVIPLTLFIPYYQQFNRQIKTYDVQYGYMDLWLIQMINELQLLLVTTLYDAVSKFLIALGVCRWLYAMTKIICPAESLAPTRVSIVPDPNDSKTTTKPDVAPPSSSKGKFRRGTVSDLLPRVSARKHQIEKVGHRFLMLWGLFVLIAHLHAAHHPLHPQCRLRTRPWFTSKPGCSLLEVNCMEEKINGASSDIERIVQTVEASHIEHLVVRHCSALEVPARINALSHLMGLKIYNSSIANWSEEAAVTSSRHPMLKFIFLINMNATEFPPGLLSPEFPQKLSQVVISKSNISEIPDNLDTIWPKRLILILEEMPLRVFPLVVLHLQPVYLSLALDELTAIPTALIEAPFISLLVLSGNPLQSLPTNPRIHPQFGWLSLVLTKINYLPDWMTDKSYVLGGFITAAGTPLCDRMIANGEAAAALRVTPTGISGIDCSRMIVVPGPVNWYPINYEEVRNPSYTLK